MKIAEVDIESSPLPEGTFDLVVQSRTLEDVQRPGNVLEGCRRVLVPGGFCILTAHGADAWRHVIDAGFAECRIVAHDAGGATAYEQFLRGQRAMVAAWI